MSNKGRQNKVSQEVANPTVSKAEAEMAKNSIDTAKQAKKSLITTVRLAQERDSLSVLRCIHRLTASNGTAIFRTGSYGQRPVTPPGASARGG